MALNGQLKRVQHSFGGIKVGDDPLTDRNRMTRYTKRLRIKAEIDNQFFRSSGDAAEIGVIRRNLRNVNLYLDSLSLLLRRGGRGGGFRFRRNIISITIWFV